MYMVYQTGYAIGTMENDSVEFEKKKKSLHNCFSLSLSLHLSVFVRLPSSTALNPFS